MRLSEAAALYLEARTAEGFSPYTIAGYRIQYRLLCRYLDDPDCQAITTDQLRQYFARDANQRKPATIGHRIRAIYSLFKWLVWEGYQTADPSVRIRERTLPPPIPKALSAERLEIVRDACRTPREHAIIEMFFATGARLNELHLCNRDDVQWSTRSLIVYGKGRKERECYFGHRAALWLRRYLAQREDSNTALFVTLRRPQRRISNRALYEAVKRIARRAGLGDIVSPHVMRHSLATHLLDHGADVLAIQSQLGHSKPETTLRYLKLSGSRRRMEYEKYFMQ